MTIREDVIQLAALELVKNSPLDSLQNYRQNTNMALANARDNAPADAPIRSYLGARRSYRSKQLLSAAIARRAALLAYEHRMKARRFERARRSYFQRRILILCGIPVHNSSYKLPMSYVFNTLDLLALRSVMLSERRYCLAHSTPQFYPRAHYVNEALNMIYFALEDDRGAHHPNKFQALARLAFALAIED